MDFIIEDDLEKLFEAEIINISLTICRCHQCRTARAIEVTDDINNDSYRKYKKMVGGRDFFRCVCCEYINLLPIRKDNIEYPKATVKFKEKIKNFGYDTYRENYFLISFICKLMEYDFKDEGI